MKTVKLKKDLPSKGDRLGWRSLDEQKKISFSRTLENSQVITRKDFSPDPILVP